MEGSVSGNDLTMQRYLNNAEWTNWEDGWHILSSPVAEQAISTAFTTDPYDFYCWSESSNIWVNYKNTTVAPTWSTANTINNGLTNSTANFLVGKGYMAAYDAEGTKEFIGSLNESDVSISGLAINSGSWHLLGNPFASALTWDATWTTSNIAGTIQIWNESGQSYSSIAANPGGVIPATNGFMVQVSTGTGSLTIPKSKRAHNEQAFYKRADFPYIKLKANNVDSPSFQETQLLFNPESTTGYEMEYDGDFLPGYAPLFYSCINGNPMAVNSMPNVLETMSVPLTFIKNEGIDFSIEMYEIENMEMDVWLLDTKLNHDHNLSDSPVYYFASEEGDIPERFVVHFSPLSINFNQLPEQLNIFSSDNNIEIRSNKPIDATINVFSISGQLLASAQLNRESSASVNIPNYKGVAIVSVVTSGQTVTEKVIIW